MSFGVISELKNDDMHNFANNRNIQFCNMSKYSYDPLIKDMICIRYIS